MFVFYHLTADALLCLCTQKVAQKASLGRTVTNRATVPTTAIATDSMELACVTPGSTDASAILVSPHHFSGLFI